MGVIDKTTGREVPKTVQDQSFGQSQVTSPTASMSVTDGTSSTATQGRQAQQTASYSLNTTPEILAALHTFIGQMSDRPNIDAASLDVQAPLPVKKFVPGGGGPSYIGAFGSPSPNQSNGQFVFIDPKSGQTLTDQQAAKLTAERMAQREKLTAEAGITKGGTVEQQVQQAERKTEIDRNRAQQGKYSKEAALADAQGLSSYFARVLSEQQMPGILRAAEGSGASQGTTRALLTQQAISRTSENAAKLGAELSASYGGISNQLAGVLEMLTRSDPNSVSAQLLQALNVGKGISQAQSGSSNTQSEQQQQGTQQQTQQAVKSAEIVDTNRRYEEPGSRNNYGLTMPTALAPAQSGNPRVYQYEVHRPPTESGTMSGEPATVIYGKDDENVIFED